MVAAFLRDDVHETIGIASAEMRWLTSPFLRRRPSSAGSCCCRHSPCPCRQRTPWPDCHGNSRPIRPVRVRLDTIPDVAETGHAGRQRRERTDALGADQQASRSSLVTTVCRRTLATSTTGAAPVTVIVSAMLPTRSSPSTLAVNPADSRMPSRTTVPNRTG